MEVLNNEFKNQVQFDLLETRLKEKWSEIINNSSLIELILKGKATKKLFALYMLETYQYTYHNARNQALVATRNVPMHPQYMKFCFEHAEEETGHELMALHDAMTVGLKKDSFEIPEPLDNTDIFIAYLYWISSQGNPVQRLGYSYWAEDSYRFINPIIQKLKQTLRLEDSQLTFFISHSSIDEDHAKEVKEVMDKHCKTPKDWADVEKVMMNTLDLQSKMLDGIYEEYLILEKGEKSRYEFLNILN